MSKAKRKPAERPRESAAPRATAPPRLSANVVLFGGLAVWLAILATMVLFDSYAFVFKSAVVPVLLLAAVLSRRFSGFVNDWAIFLGVIVLLDSARSAVYAAITYFQLPMYAVYPIDWDQWLLFGTTAPVAMHALRESISNPLWLDRFFILLHASHFLVFLLFGFVLWLLDRRAFRTYAVAMSSLLALGLLVQFAVPTIPPWLASRDFLLLPPIPRLIHSIYNTHLPGLVAIFDINPIAAMPSLHSAMPALCAFFALYELRLRGLVVLVYALGVCVAVMYLGEHYLVDVIAGVALSAAICAAAIRWGAVREVPDAAVAATPEHLAPVPIVVALVLVAAAFGLGQVAGAWLAPLPITRAFVERELLDRSPTAHFFLGRLAYEAKDYALAKTELTIALGELLHASDQNVIRTLLGQSALLSGDNAAAISALEPMRANGAAVDNLVLLARAYSAADRYDDAVAVLSEAQRRFPVEPEPIYWLARYRYQRHEIDRAALAAVVEALAKLPAAKADQLSASLAAMP